MTNEERQQAIEWLKRRPVVMAGAKRMYDLAVEALEAYVPDMNVGETEPSRESDTEITRCSDDTISRQAAINKILGQPPEPHYPSWYAEQIKELPPAQPEIIYCKDCKHWIPYDWMFSEVWQSKNIADYPEDEIGCNFCDMAMKANDFCSRGEMREDG